MSDVLQKDYLDRLAQHCVSRVVEMVQRLGTSLIDDDKMAFGDVELSTHETIAQVAGAIRSGEMDVMRDVAPREAERRLREGARAAEEL